MPYPQMQPGTILYTSRDSVLIWILLIYVCLNTDKNILLPNVGFHERLWFSFSSYKLIWIFSRLAIRQRHPYILTSRAPTLEHLPWKHFQPFFSAVPCPCFCFFFLNPGVIYNSLPCGIDQRLWGSSWLAFMRISRDFWPHLILGYQSSKKIVPTSSLISLKVFSWRLQTHSFWANLSPHFR